MSTTASSGPRLTPAAPYILAVGILSSGQSSVEIVNDLTSGGAKKALSAEMGKKLQTEKVAVKDITSALTETSGAKVLSAKAGKELNDGKMNKVADFTYNGNVDLDTLEASGCYMFGDGVVLTNLPDGISGSASPKKIILRSYKVDDRDAYDSRMPALQILYDCGSQRIFMRQGGSYAGDWSIWMEAGGTDRLLQIPPSLNIRKNRDAGSADTVIGKLEISHPLMGYLQEAELVLMTQSRNGRPKLSKSRGRQSRWHEAWGRMIERGGYAFRNNIELYDFYTEIVRRFVSLGTRTGEEMLGCDYSDFLNAEDVNVLFSATVSKNTAGQRPKKSKLFGIALRIPNPKFKADADKDLVATTMDIEGVPRYLYSPVVKFRMNINQRKDQTGGATLGISIL